MEADKTGENALSRKLKVDALASEVDAARENLNVKSTNLMRWEQDAKARVGSKKVELEGVQMWEGERQGKLIALIVEEVVGVLGGDEWHALRQNIVP